MTRWAEHVEWNKEDFVNTNGQDADGQLECGAKLGELAERRDAAHTPSWGRTNRVCEKTLRCRVSSPIISERKRLAFAPGRERGPHDTEVGAELWSQARALRLSPGHFVAQPQRWDRSSCRGWAKSHTHLFRIYQDSPDKPPFIPDLPPFILH